MKKLKLLLMACTLVGSVISANAREDVTSTYLTDAVLENESDNWALVNGPNNHNWNSTYQFHESWHNNFSISQTVSSLPNGYYQISIQAVNSVIPSSNAKLTATSGDNTASAYIRHSSAGSFAEISRWLSEDPLACRIYATVKVDNGSLTVGFSQPNAAEWIVYGQFKLYSLTEEEYTNAIILQNAVESNANGWSNDWTNGGNQYTFGRERFNETAYEEGKVIYKNFANLPKGKYDVTVLARTNVAWREAATGDNIAEVYANDGKYSLTVNAETGFTPSSNYHYTISDVLASDGNIEVGIRNIATGGNWYVISLVNLLLKEPYISYVATEIPAATAITMTANTWYKFTPASSEDYSFTAETIGDIIYTTADQLLSEATGTAATATMALTGNTTYYLKSSTAQTLTITPQTFTYTVGAATPSVAEGGYTQSTTFTLTFEATTDDPEGTLSILDATKITVNSTQASASITDNVLTITLTDAITAATDYTISVAAGAVGYNTDNANAATTLTIHTPAILDGTYYLYDEGSKKFLSRGSSYGSHAVVDLYGLPFNVRTDKENKSSIEFLDWKDKYLFKNSSNELYTDNNSTGFTFSLNSGKYYLKTIDNRYSYITDGKVNTTDAEASATLWTLMSKAERDKIVAAYPAANKTNVITAASINTTSANFESYLADNYAAKDQTSKVGTPKFTEAGGAGSWTWTSVTGNPTFGDDWTEGFQIAGTWSQTINGLTPGIYKVTVNGFERKAGYALCNTLAGQGYELVTAYFKANNEQLPLKSWYSDKEGTNNPDNTSQAATAFNNDKYMNTIYTYVTDAGEGTGSLTLTIGKQDKVSDSWVLFNNVTLTFYDETISDADATAIIEDAEGEMAKPMKPSLYQALATAKSTFETTRTMPNYNALRTAIDNTASSVASYAAMNTDYLEPIAAVLVSSNIINLTNNSAYTDYLAYKAKYENYKNSETADIENVDANALKLYQGNGTKYTNIGNILMTTGWEINGSDALTDGSGFYTNTWSTENAGESPAKDFARPFYEMWVSSGSIAAATLTRTITGLTPNTIYSVTSNVRVQYSSKVDGSITMKVGNGSAIDVTTGSKIGETNRYIGEFTTVGKADESGNLTITIEVAENSGISWLAFRDVNYAEATTVDVAITSVGLATYASDNDLDFTYVEGLKAHSAKVTGEKATFTQVTTVPAGEGVLLEGAEGTYSVPVITGLAKWADADNDFIRGTGAAIETGTGDVKNYILSTDNDGKNVGFYYANGETVPTDKAYLKSTASAGSRLLMIFEGEATGIKTIDRVRKSNALYNLNGTRVAKPTKGLYIQDGKKVIIK